MSGNTAIKGAVVNLYATGSIASATSANNYGYGQAATLLATADAVTDSTGAFKFTSSSQTCPLGSYAYVTVSGGDAGGGANAGTLLMAMLGPCSSLYDSAGSTYTGPAPVVNEATTVAAGYALSNFMTVSGTTVNISAPVTDNFSDGSSAWNGSSYAACSGTACQGNSKLDSTSGNEITYSNGLQHAASTAINLVNVSTGVTNACIVGGQGAAACPGGGPAGIIPKAEVNSLANALQLCVATSGATGTCPSLYSYAKNKVTATNTLQAILNLVKNPDSSAAATSGLFTLQAGHTLVYTPTLASAPPDWCIDISYEGGGLDAPQYLALDSNDTIYVDSIGAGSGGDSLIALTNAGNFVYGEYAPVLSADGTSQNVVASPVGIATDSLGHLFVAANTSDGSSGAYEYNTADASFVGFLGHNPAISNAVGVSLDRRNSLWISYSGYGSGNLDYLLQNGSTTTTGTTGGYSFFANSNVPSGSTLGAPVAANGAYSEVSTVANTNLAFTGIDQNQNVWATIAGNTTTAGKQLGVFVNGHSSSPSSQPAYDNSTTAGTGVYSNPEIIATFSAACANPSPWAVAFDSTGNAYTSEYTATGTKAMICETPAVYTGGVLTGTGTTTAYSFNTSSAKGMPQGLAMDGGNVLWTPLMYTVTTGYFGIFGYDTVAKTALFSAQNGLRGCFITTALACATSVSLPNNSATSNYLTVANPRAAAIDSSGNIWTTQPDFGTVVETIGLAAPTVPLIAAAKFGVLP